MALRAVPTTCLALFVLVEMVTGQLQDLDAINPFNSIDGRDVLNKGTTDSSTVRGQDSLSASTPRDGSNSFERAGTKTGLSFGALCSLDSDCNPLLGLTCISYDNYGARCGCGPPTPIYVSEGSDHKCVRPKELYEACVSNHECSFRNPNVHCINFLCNCSAPFELTPARLCQLPPASGGSIFTTAFSVMLGLALLIIAGGYAYQRMLRERERTSSLSTAARCRNLRVETSSTETPTTSTLGRGQPWGDKKPREDCEVCDQEDHQPRRWDRWWRPRQEPRHPPRYIAHRDSDGKATALSTVHECCSRAERSSPCGSEQGRAVCLEKLHQCHEASLHRARMGPRYIGRCGCPPDAEFNVKTSQPPLQPLVPKDAQMQRLLHDDDQQVVVTVEGQNDRTTVQSPVVSVRKRELPSESTDPFMKEVKRRRERGTRFSVDDVSTADAASTRESVSQAAPRRVSVVAVQSGASLQDSGIPAPTSPPPPLPPAEMPEGKPTTQETAAGVDTAVTIVPVHAFSMAASAKQQNGSAGVTQHEPSGNSKLTDHKMVNDGGSVVTRAVPDSFLPPSAHNKLPREDWCERTSLRQETCVANTRRASSPPAMTTTGRDDDKPAGSRSSPMSSSQSAKKSAQNTRKCSVLRDEIRPITTDAATDAADRLSTRDAQTSSPILSGLEASRPPTEHRKMVEGATITKPLTDAKVGLSSPGIHDTQMLDPVEEHAQSSPKRQSLGTSNGAIKEAKAEARSDETTSTTEASLSQPLRSRKHSRAQKPDKKQAQQFEIEQVGEIARLLSGLLEKHAKESKAPSQEDNRTAIVQSSEKPSTTAKFESAQCSPRFSGPAPSRRDKERTKRAPRKSLDDTTSDVKPALRTRTQAASNDIQTSQAIGPKSDLTQDCNSEQLGDTLAYLTPSTAEPKKSTQTSAAVIGPLTNGPREDPEVIRSGSIQFLEAISDAARSKKAAVNAKSSIKSKPNAGNADDAKYGSDRIGGKLPEPIPLPVPQDYRGWVSIGASYAAQKFEDQATSENLSRQVAAETRGTSTASGSESGDPQSNLRSQPSSASVGTEETPSVTLQRPFQEYIAKQLQRPVRFAERPFEDVLASLESDRTSVLKDYGKEAAGAPGDAGLASGTQQSSSQSDIDDENLDEAAIEHASKQSASDVASKSDEAAETSTAAASMITPSKLSRQSAKSAANATTTTTTTTTATTKEADEASQEMPRARLANCASDEGSMPPSESMSLSFLSSDSSSSMLRRASDLADLQRLERIAAAKRETGDGAMLSLLPRGTSSSAGQEYGSRHFPPHPTDRDDHAPEPASDRSRRNQDRQAPRLEIRPPGATYRPWTKEEVVTLGIADSAIQRATQRLDAKSAMQRAQFQADSQGQPAIAASAGLEMPESFRLLRDELARKRCEFVQRALTRSGTASSNAARSESGSEPFRLRDLVIRQHPKTELEPAVKPEQGKASSVLSLRDLCKKRLEAPSHGSPEAPRNNVAPFSGARPKAAAGANAPPHIMQRRNTCAAPGSESFSAAAALAREPKQESKSSEAVFQLARPRTSVTSDLPTDVEQARRFSKGEKGTATRKAPIRFFGPQCSDNIVVLPDSSAALYLPSSASLDALSTAVSGGFRRHSIAASKIGPGGRRLLMTSALEDPSFESIYNAILQPAHAPLSPERDLTPTGANTPGDTPGRPARTTSSSRGVSFDNSPTVVPLEPPPGQFTPQGGSDAAADVELVTSPPVYRPRRHSSVCQSSSGSLYQEAAEGTEKCQKSKRGAIRLPPAQPGAERTAPADSGVPGSAVGGAAPAHDPRRPLISPFFSFEDTGSQISCLPDSTNVEGSGSLPASKQSEEEPPRDGPRGSLA